VTPDPAPHVTPDPAPPASPGPAPQATPESSGTSSRPRTPVRVDLERAGELPRPGRHRWQPLRVGLLDLFHYDYQEFWFRDGRLLWRGNNGTGKSKVLALTLPFLLDGEASAHRVEPDGDVHKRMEWNLLLGGRYQERLGYTWIEFGRSDDDGTAHYLTAGIALKAADGRGVADRWFFVTDRRVGVDLPLVTATGTALSRDRLVEAVGDRGQVVRTAEHYRRLLDDRLFQLGADRYGALVDLLVQLRQPQLSKRPDPVLLSRALSEALPPLDPGLLADAAAGFHDLEQQRAELRSLVDTHADLQRFQARYIRYAGVAARRQSRELRGAHSAYEDTGRRLGEVRQQAEQAAAVRDEVAERVEQLRRRRVELEAEREQLRESPELRELDRLSTEAEAADRRSAEATRRAGGVRERHQRAAERADRVGSEAEAARRHRDDLVDAAGRTAAVAASETAHAHAVTAPGILDDPAVLRRALTAVADDRGAALDVVRRLAAEAEDAAGRHTAQLARLSGLEADRDAAADAYAGSRAAAEAEGEGYLGAWRDFAARTDAVAVPYPEEVGLPGWVVDLAGPDPAFAVLDDRVQAVRRGLAGADAAARARLAETAGRIEDLAVRRAELEAGIAQPPPSPGTRDDAARAGRPGAPLWRVVDVRERPRIPVTEDGRAGLEAALQASGLLDAWVTPEGRLLGPDDLDAALVPSPGGTGPEPEPGSADPAPGPASRTLDDLLQVVIDPDDPQAGALTEGTVRAVLRAVGVVDTVAGTVADTGTAADSADFGPAADRPGTAADRPGAAVVGLDGGYQLGLLRGRWTKPAAEHLGATARERARRARLAELEMALDAAEQDRAAAETELARVAAAETRLAEQLRARPVDQALRDAHARVAAARTEAERREAALYPARTAAEDARRAAEDARRTLTESATDLALPTEPDRQREVAEALGRYRAVAGELVAAAQRFRDRLADVDTWNVEREAAREALVEVVEEETRAGDEHRAAAARLRALQDRVGDTAGQLRERLDRAVAELAAVSAEQRSMQDRHTEAALALGQAQGQEQVLRDEQQERMRARDAAVLALRAFTVTGLLGVALPELDIPDPGAGWAADPAVRLARRIEAALAEVDDADPAWRRVQDDITRRFAELAESLSRHGHQAHADLREGRYVVSVVYSGRERGPGELIALLGAEIALRERELTSREQQVLEEHLVGDVASRLQELITDADALVGWMNAELAERPTSTGMRLRLVWKPDPDGPEGLAEARTHLLRQTSQLWSAEDRRVVRDFLQRQIQRMRLEDPEGTWTDHLRQALDYRAWHRFVIERFQDGTWRSAIGPASGGERVLTVSLPLFAAASAHYRSAHPDAPRLVLLDEAFAGVDDDSRAKALGLLTQFDLDVAMTSEREWGFYATVPGIATYQLVRHEGVDAVHVSVWEWDGAAPQQVTRPVVLPRAADPAAAPSGAGRDTVGAEEPLF
jgi:uncharacterized protein (TIGR02680 family)